MCNNHGGYRAIKAGLVQLHPSSEVFYKARAATDEVLGRVHQRHR